MNNDALMVIESIFNTIWKLFTSWYIPGTNITPAVHFFGTLFVCLVLRFIFKITGLWGDPFE